MPSVTISTTPVLIYSGSASRIDVLLRNYSGSTCWIGGGSNVSVGNTVYLNPNDVLIDDYSGIKGYRGSLWGVTSSGTCKIVWWERSQ